MTDITQEQQDERDKLILEIMAFAYLVNQRTEYCAFVDYHGHVDNISIEIARSKTRWQDKLAHTSFKCDYADELFEGNNWLRMKRDMLKQILDTKEIPYENMKREVEHVYHHYF